MARARKPATEYTANQAVGEQRGDQGTRVSLRSALSKKPTYKTFEEWIIGDTPIITHAWSHKAKEEMLQKQVGAVKGGKDARDPEADFVSSLYEMGTDAQGKKLFGFPATGIKKCITSAAHKDKGIAKTAVKGALWLDASVVRVRPALAGAICDMPLIRIYGSEPQMREDMVRIGTGLSKVAQLAYRAQFWPWAMLIRGRFNNIALKEESLAFLIQESGILTGLAEWRNEKDGMFGAFHLGDAEEAEAWYNYARGKGPLPAPPDTFKEAAE